MIQFLIKMQHLSKFGNGMVRKVQVRTDFQKNFLIVRDQSAVESNTFTKVVTSYSSVRNGSEY